MQLRTYAVTVMDHWTPMRYFWTLSRARKWQESFVGGNAYLYRWHPNLNKWVEAYPDPLSKFGQQYYHHNSTS